MYDDDLGIYLMFGGIVIFAGIIVALCIFKPDFMRQVAESGWCSGWVVKDVNKEELKEEGYTVSVDDNGNVQLTNEETGEVIKTEGITINNNGTLNITINIENIENIENMTLSDLLQYVEGSENP